MVVGLLWSSGVALACGPYYYTPRDLGLYRLLPYGYQPPGAQHDFASQNCAHWCRAVGLGEKDTAAVRYAVYGYSLADWERIRQGGKEDNRFVRRLDREGVRLLYWSKLYESVRNAQRSPWYYNSRVSNEQAMLRQLADSLAAVDPRCHKDRYLFLRMKVLWAVGSTAGDTASTRQCLALWHQGRQALAGSPVEQQAMDYAARCYSALGQPREAYGLYRQMGDTPQYMLQYGDLAERLRAYLRLDPNSPLVASELQPLLEGMDHGESSQSWVYGGVSERLIDRVLAVAQEAIVSPRVDRKAVWRYTAACILDHRRRPAEALAQLQGAEGGDGDAFLRGAVRVMEFYLRGKLEPVSDRFEQYALGELRWMDDELQREYRSLPDSLRQRTRTAEDNWDYGTWTRRRHLYFAEAMLRIATDDTVGLAWRMAAAGRQVRALQVANMASNRLMQVCGNSRVDSARHCPERWNSHDYSNPLFLLADTMCARTLEHYRQRMLHPTDETDRWLNARSYTDGDYWQDIVGTHYLRERNYPAAVSHLQHVAPQYQRRMNICFSIDPFSIDRTQKSHDSTRYKLHFAQRMAALQHTMLHAPDADERGLAMLEYSIGLENSFDMCWWLTSYGRSRWADLDESWPVWDCSPEERLSATPLSYAHKARAAVRQLRTRACATLRTPDARARYHARLGQLATVMKHYPDTPTAQHYALVCDKWSMYRQKKMTCGAQNPQ